MVPKPRPTKKEMVTAFRTREILAAARQVMEQQGLEAMTMEEIAAVAGVAKGTIYLYFSSKEELIQAFMSQVGENLMRDLETSLAAPGSPPERLHRMASVLLEYLGREWLLFPVYARDFLWGPRRARKGHWQRIQELEDKFVALVTQLFAEGIEEGYFIRANPRLLTFIFREMVRSVGYYRMEEGPTEPVAEALPVLVALLTSGLTRQSHRPAEVAAP